MRCRFQFTVSVFWGQRGPGPWIIMCWSGPAANTAHGPSPLESDRNRRQLDLDQCRSPTASRVSRSKPAAWWRWTRASGLTSGKRFAAVARGPVDPGVPNLMRATDVTMITIRDRVAAGDIPIIRRRICHRGPAVVRMDDNDLRLRGRFGSRQILCDLAIAGPPVRPPIVTTNRIRGLPERLPPLRTQGMAMARGKDWAVHAGKASEAARKTAATATSGINVRRNRQHSE